MTGLFEGVIIEIITECCEEDFVDPLFLKKDYLFRFFMVSFFCISPFESRTGS